MRTYQLNAGIQTSLQSLQSSAVQVSRDNECCLCVSPKVIALAGGRLVNADHELQVGAILGRLGVGQRDLVYCLVEEQVCQLNCIVLLFK